MAAPEPAISKAGDDYRNRYEELTGSSFWECPVCHKGRILVIEILPPNSNPLGWHNRGLPAQIGNADAGGV